MLPFLVVPLFFIKKKKTQSECDAMQVSRRSTGVHAHITQLADSIVAANQADKDSRKKQKKGE